MKVPKMQPENVYLLYPQILYFHSTSGKNASESQLSMNTNMGLWAQLPFWVVTDAHLWTQMWMQLMSVQILQRQHQYMYLNGIPETNMSVSVVSHIIYM